MYSRRLFIVAVPFAAYFAALLARLFSMQVLEAETWREEASLLSRRVVRVPARRGAILDRRGEVLAEDRFELDLVVRLDRLAETSWRCAACGRPAWTGSGRPPRRCADCGHGAFAVGTPADLGALATLLSKDGPRLPELIEASFAEYRKEVEAEVKRREEQFGRAEREDVERVLLRRERLFLPAPEAALVREVALHPERYHGLDVRPSFRRVAPAGETVEKLVGRTGPLSMEEGTGLRERGYTWSEIWKLEVGRSGLEMGFEDRLRSREGRKEVERDARGHVAEVLYEEPPVDGVTVRTTIDLSLQRVATEALAAACRQHGAEGGAFAAIDPRNGEVLVLASTGEGIAGNLNLAVLPAVPGSTFKILTALAGLETGSLDPAETFECAGPWHRIGCSHEHGTIALHEAVSQSCNKYFAFAAERMGIDALHPFALKLGFGAPTGLPLPEEAGGLVPNPEWKRRRYPKDPVLHVGEVRQLGFGSGALLVTPLQVARLMAVVANGGRLVRPVLGLGEGAPGVPVASSRSVAIVREAMIAVVEEGTGKNLGLSKYRAAGKTGTAEVIADQKVHMGWFSGFAPAEAPTVAFACYLRRVAVYGAEAAGPVTAAFLAEYFKR